MCKNILQQSPPIPHQEKHSIRLCKNKNRFHICRGNDEQQFSWSYPIPDWFPIDIIEKGIHNAILQGSAPAPQNKTIIPLISTYYRNYDKSLIGNSKNQRGQEAFKDVEFIHARRQPPNLLQQITNAPFITGETTRITGITLCHIAKYAKSISRSALRSPPQMEMNEK